MPQPELAGIHHVKIPVTDLGRSVEWYRRVFGLRPRWEFPDADEVVRGVGAEMPGLDPALVAMRVNPQAAASYQGFDPVGFAVKDRDDLVAWAAHLDALGIAHSPVIDASIGWLLIFNDPDGLELHLYSWAQHGIDQSGRPGYGRPIANPDTWTPAG